MKGRIAATAVSFRHKVKREREEREGIKHATSLLFLSIFIFLTNRSWFGCLLLLQRLKNEIDLIISFFNFRTLCLTFAKGELQRNTFKGGANKRFVCVVGEGGVATSLSRAALFNFSKYVSKFGCVAALIDPIRPDASSTTAWSAPPLLRFPLRLLMLSWLLVLSG